MDASLIGNDAHFVVAAVLIAITAFGYAVEKTPFGRQFSSVLPVIFTATLLSNLGVIPKSAPVYGAVWSYLIPLAIPLLLFKADLRRAWSETGSTMIAFLFGACGVLTGAFLGFSLLPMGDDGPAIAALFSATYIGGSINFAAVAEAIDYTDPSKLTPAIAVENVIGISFLLLLIMLPSLNWLKRYFPEKAQTVAEETTSGTAPEKATLDFGHLSAGLAISMAIYAACSLLASYLQLENYKILLITAAALTLANLAPKAFSKLSGDFELGMFFLLIFFATIGAGTDLAGMTGSAAILAVMAAMMMMTHAIFVLIAGRLFKLSLEDMIIGSNACILGAPTAAAQAASRNWRALVTPAILCGLFGNAIANFIGVALYELLR